MTSERKCEECMHFGVVSCFHVNTKYFTAEMNRAKKDDCGPAGRYWEPRESQDEQ